MCFPTPTFFIESDKNIGENYTNWLTKRSKSLMRHDRKKGNTVHPIGHYRQALHTAMIRSQGFDEYSGEPINWSLAFTNRNGKVGAKSRRKFSDAPSVDHITGGGLGVAICRDDTNTAKGCMTPADLHAFCKAVASRPPRFC